MGYFLGRIPNDNLLCTWVSQVWIPYGVKVENIHKVENVHKEENIHKVDNIHNFLSKGPWTICNSLLVSQPYTIRFNIENEGVVDTLVWVEFLGLPLPLLKFLHTLVDAIG